MPCLLCYMKDEGCSQKKDCPMCMERIQLDDLKSVHVLEGFATKDPTKRDATMAWVSAGQVVDLCLVSRKRHSTLALPVVEIHIPSKTHAIEALPDISHKNAMRFSRCMVATENYMRSEYQRDISEVQLALGEALDAKANEQVVALHSSVDSINKTLENIRISYASISTATKTKKKKKKESSSFVEDDGSYYFYQAVDGQYVYLSSLNIRMLRHEYGDYPFFPRQLSAFVEAVKEVTMTETLRRYYKYLGHLPLGCNITFVHIDLSMVLSKTTLGLFKRSLKKQFPAIISAGASAGASGGSSEDSSEESEGEEAEGKDNEEKDWSYYDPKPKDDVLYEVYISKPTDQQTQEEIEQEELEYVLQLSAAEYASQQDI
ncbi:hypothetical protein BDF14DRAFT_1841727 [Spinellus fusiger]|nr:hypothetical protein BDF14DRAFT_1841727 [Spinellus fusiger]